MTCRGVNFKLDDEQIDQLRRLAEVYHMSMTDIVRDSLNDYFKKAQRDPYYMLTNAVEEADCDESEDVLAAIESLDADDLAISSSKLIIADNRDSKTE